MRESHLSSISSSSYLFPATALSTYLWILMFFTKIILLMFVLWFGYIHLPRICAKHRAYLSFTYSQVISHLFSALSLTLSKAWASSNPRAILFFLFSQNFISILKNRSWIKPRAICFSLYTDWIIDKNKQFSIEIFEKVH